MTLFGPNRAPQSKPARSARQRKRRVVTPLVMQTHMTECGAACLGSVLAYFERWAPLSELRKLCGVSRDGSTAAGLSRAAGRYGLKCVGRNVNARHLRGMPLPQILFWEWNHFLVLEGFDRKWVFLNDPAVGRRRLSMEEFAEGFAGIALHFTPKPEFRRGGVPPSNLRRIPPWFRGAWGALAYMFACGLAMAVTALTAPVALGLFVDHVMRQNQPWGPAVAGVIAAAAVLVYGLGWLKQRCMARLSVRISIIAGDRFVSKLLRLPLEYFSHRLTGELTDRVMAIDRIAKRLPSHFIDLLIEIAASAVFLAAMLAYDARLALIVLGLAASNVLLSRVITRARSDENQVLRREQGMLAGFGMLMLRQTSTLRMITADDGFFTRWSGYHARVLAIRQRFLELGHVSAALPGLFTILAQAAVLALAAGQVMDGEMTLGALAAFYILATLFLAPIGRFVEFADDWQALETELRRLDDITDTDEDRRFAHKPSASATIDTLDGRMQLAGRLELRGVTFGYARGRPPLIENFDLIIEPGQRVAVVGASGSGKSTLAAIVSGVYEPWSGEVLFDGRLRDEIPDEVMTRSLSMVDQNPILFAASVRDNITLWNSAVPDDIVVAAARDACIHGNILSRALGYASPVAEDGRNFSGGERQRLEIARALAGNPTLLILDEATSALDAATEARFDDALRRRGISCLIIAHRLSTIRDCDRIIVLDRGSAAQSGSHEELMADEKGLYYRLVKAG